MFAAGGKLIRNAGKKILPRRGSTAAARVKGKIGEALTQIERSFRGEKIVGKQVRFISKSGAKADFDFVTQNQFTGKINVVEAKFGTSADLVRGQPVVAKQIGITGSALVRGPKSMATMRRLGFQGPSTDRGLNVSGLGFVKQKFNLLSSIWGRLLY